MFINLIHFYSSTPTPSYEAIARSLRKKGHKVFVAQPDQNRGFIWFGEDGIVNHIQGPSSNLSPRLGFIVLLRRVKKYLQNIKPDIIQVNPALWSWYLPLGMPGGTKFILDVRLTGSGSENKIINWLKDQKTKIAWRIIGNTIYSHTLFLNDMSARWLWGNRRRKMSSVIPLGVDESFLKYQRPSLWSNSNGLVRFIYAGTISKIRKLECVLQAVNLLREESNNFKVTLAGPDDGAGSVAYYQDLINKLNLDQYIQIMDAVPYQQVPDLLSQHDVALNFLPIIRGNCRQPSMKVLEACALGMPQIVTKIDANYEYVTDGINGLYVDDTPDGLAGGMHRFITDRNWLEHCWSSALTKRDHCITWDEVAEKYLNVYQAVLDKSPSRKKTGI